MVNKCTAAKKVSQYYLVPFWLKWLIPEMWLINQKHENFSCLDSCNLLQSFLIEASDAYYRKTWKKKNSKCALFSCFAMVAHSKLNLVAVYLLLCRWVIRSFKVVILIQLIYRTLIQAFSWKLSSISLLWTDIKLWFGICVGTAYLKTQIIVIYFTMLIWTLLLWLCLRSRFSNVSTIFLLRKHLKYFCCRRDFTLEWIIDTNEVWQSRNWRNSCGFYYSLADLIMENKNFYIMYVKPNTLLY